jgi:hypothetical protein
MRHRSFACLVTLVAFMVATLAPAWAHAAGTARDGLPTWMSICSTTSVAGQGRGDSPAERAHPVEHCPYCTLQHPALGMPPTRARIALPPAASTKPPVVVLRAPRTLFAWVAGQPRAPPHAS